MTYSPTVWVNKVTTLGPTNLNKLEQGVANAAAVADSALSAGSGAIPLTQKGVANGVSTLDAGTKVPIAQLPAGVANGVASLDANGHVPGAQRSYYGTTPPASPQDGDLWDFPADAANGVIWRFRYRAASASAYKWEFVGGTPLLSFVPAQETTTTTATWLDLATVGPRVIVPRAGDYNADADALLTHSAAGGAVSIGIAIGASAPIGGVTVNASAGFYFNFLRQRLSFAGRVAGDELRLRYYNGNAGTFYAVSRSLSVTPVRVS